METAAPVICHNEKDDINWQAAGDVTEQAVQWVEDNKSTITGHACKYLLYSPYPLQEFLQEAYVTACKASEMTLKNGKPELFERFFWTGYKSACCELTYAKGEKNLRITLQPYKEIHDNDGPATKVPTAGNDPLSALIQKERKSRDNENEILKNEILQKALDVMSPRQSEVWKYLLGHHGSIPCDREIAAKLGITRQGVEKIRDQGLKRAQKKLSQTFGPELLAAGENNL